MLSPPYATLTYAAPQWLPESAWAAGMRVLLPMGKSLRVGVLLEERNPEKDPPDPSMELKELLWPLDRPGQTLLDAGYMHMVRDLAVRQMDHPGRILGSVLPQPMRSSQAAFRLFDGPKPVALRARQLAAKSFAEKIRLAQLWEQGAMLPPEPQANAGTDYCTVAADPPWPIRPAAKRQVQLMEYLWDRGPTPKPFLLKELGPAGARALSLLAGRGLVTIGPPPQGTDPAEDDETPEAVEKLCQIIEPVRRFQLNAEQQGALQGLTELLHDPAGKTALLFGVTGSGKTAVYLELARECLESGRSALLLAPEVALACSLRRAAAEFFSDAKVYFYHGYQTPARREAVFARLARSTEPALVVGARSALFLPLPRLGLAVLDEEHDGSFKQDERLTYQAKEVAWSRVTRSGGLLVLGSATPDVKTFHAAQQAAMPVFSMYHRVGSNPLPEVQLADIRSQGVTEQLLSEEARQRLRDTVERGEQAIIMLNRRGYAPLMYCQSCECVLKCPHCDIGLTYHKGRERVVCHYCGWAKPFPLLCDSCGACEFLPMGEGSEKLEEGLAHVAPGAAVLRLDRDSTRRPGRMEEILADFAAGKAQILVGTQMLSKGHHFPDVTLVIVADGDLGLNLPDYRATERTFQLLVQVAGRAGRGDKPGQVLIQTRMPSHFCWDYVKSNDYEGFFARELELRQRRRYPPFVKLALIRMNYPMDWEDGPQVVADAAKTLRLAAKSIPGVGDKPADVAVLGPAPAPLAMLRGRKRFHVLVKSADWPSIRTVYATLRQSLPPNTKMRLSLDMDPVNML